MAEDAPRILAADWTGAREPVRNLWLAEAESGALLSLEAFRLRDDLTDRLLRIARESRDVVVGLDFVFSLPEAFLRDQDLESAAALWSHMDRKADEWLSPRLPFWDRKKPAIEQEFRQTDLDVAKAAGKHPTSPSSLWGQTRSGVGRCGEWST